MRRAKDHRPAILDAAARLFQRKRFHEVLVADVAAEAGGAKGTIYRFYRTKEELLAATCFVSLEELASELAQMAELPENAQWRLDKMLEGAARYFREHTDYFEVMQREWGQACLQRKSRYLAYRAKTRAIFAKVIRDGQAAGEFREVEASSAADMLMGMNRSMLFFGDPRLSPARVARLVLEVFLRGISVPKGEAG
jgi:TetR/AcrR family transcriptional regulator, fatty acid metabolism regulator protein